ncbi:hypothetical protein EVAR_92423_1 [Eumeta japonica]|uniref:Uncharacterized protein n=1 Tax=Eumeta variegata TaxID=151549 RepID=A0A4C1T5T4_EUMVA|nr:hypothetical protein EVAR_92423_1 [Eumeta japonica]
MRASGVTSSRRSLSLNWRRGLLTSPDRRRRRVQLKPNVQRSESKPSQVERQELDVFLLHVRGTNEPSESEWSPSAMHTPKPREVTGALPASWEAIGYKVEENGPKSFLDPQDVDI